MAILDVEEDAEMEHVCKRKQMPVLGHWVGVAGHVLAMKGLSGLRECP